MEPFLRYTTETVAYKTARLELARRTKIDAKDYTLDGVTGVDVRGLGAYTGGERKRKDGEIKARSLKAAGGKGEKEKKRRKEEVGP